ncbi:MAG: polyphosphate kinase 2 family protein [Ignavibacteria bacterium]|nr:polyphosphate kinase 2 family protein [Ignavibacteria bacterium]
MDLSKFLVQPNTKVKLSDFPSDYTCKYKSKDEAQGKLIDNIAEMADLQDKLYADDRWALLLIFQALDAAGKDGAIKHVMSGLNPQGTMVYSFKQPSAEEIDHDYLWRINKSLPERGRIGIFNRSHYEDVLVVRVHNLIKSLKMPKSLLNDNIWDVRHREIRDFEKYLSENGIVTVKFFLNLSKDEQKRRFLKRIEDPSKNWKFSASDLKERQFFKQYQKCYEEVISETSTKYSAWYIIPADKKWFARLVISEVIVSVLKSLNLSYPKLSQEQIDNLKVYKEQLLNEK